MKVLVIEDDKHIRGTLELWLQLEGFDVKVAENGPRGVEMAREEKPDLVICDLLMPGINGYAVLSELRAHASTTNIPFILLTASAEKSERERGLAMGVTEFMTKPFDLKELLAAINHCLKRAKK